MVQGDSDPWHLLSILLQHFGDLGRQVLHDGQCNGQVPGFSAPGSLRSLFRSTRVVKQLACILQQLDAGIRQLYAARGPLEQACAQIVFERLNLARQGWLSNVHRLGRDTDAPMLRHSAEVA
ncbi:hypothetical protein CBM2618_B50073 [Cupriavidus taiwanensis]|nr:hypothetical protein CBM2618_B50073 [Cupriavidus taiwanensis]SOZ91612.1 hypothetical protein CBM2622_B50072 [Cupriavidus taiwanensis]